MRQYVFLNTLEPRFNEPLYNEVLGITNHILQPSNSIMYGKEPRYNEPISPIPWHFLKSRFIAAVNLRLSLNEMVRSSFYCTTKYKPARTAR